MKDATQKQNMVKGKAGSYFSEMLFSLVREESHTPSEQSSGLSGPSHNVAERRGAPWGGWKMTGLVQGMEEI